MILSLEVLERKMIEMKIATYTIITKYRMLWRYMFEDL